MRGTPRSAAAFVGEDRRRAPTETGLGPVVLTGAVVVLLTTVAAALAPEPAQPFEVGLVLDTVTAAAAIAVFALCRARWNLVGTNPPLWAGTAVLTLGVAGVGLPSVLGPVLAGRTSVAPSTLPEAGLLVAVLAFASGALAPVVDTRVRPVVLVAGAALAVAGFAVLFDALPVLGGDVPLAVAAAAVGVLHAVRSASRRWLYGWCAVVLLGVAAGQVATGIATSTAQAVALSVAIVACALELLRDYVDQRTRLLQSEIALQATAVGERAEAAGQRQRRHDVSNAVLAIEGSAVTLERHLERLSESDRTALTAALSTGVERLQRLLGDDGSGRTVDLAGLAASVAADRGSDGTGEPVAVDVPDGLVADGSPALATEVLRLLLDNARRRAPGRPIALEGRRDGNWMVLQVRDRAAPIPRDQRRLLASADLGLLVAARLMRNQGGDVWVENHPDGGAFSLCLPAAGEQATTGAVTDPGPDDEERGADGIGA